MTRRLQCGLTNRPLRSGWKVREIRPWGEIQGFLLASCVQRTSTRQMNSGILKTPVALIQRAVVVVGHDSTHREVEGLAVDRALLDLLFLDQGFQQSEAEPLTRVVVSNSFTHIAVADTLRVVVQELDDALLESVV